MSKTNTNDRAFPSTFHNGWGEPEKGMTLRDYFAAKAMQGMYAAYQGNPPEPEHVVDDAYGIADEMLRKRMDEVRGEE